MKKEPDVAERDDGVIRQFATGATRDTSRDKPDYEGFLSPLVLERYAAYMHQCRIQSNGEYRDSDNWQRGIPRSVYMKSAWRHFMAWWKEHRLMDPGAFSSTLANTLCAVMFNVMGYLHEYLKEHPDA